MRKTIHLTLVFALIAGLFIAGTGRPQVASADGNEVWDIVDEPFNDYASWGVSKGQHADGSVTQGEGNITIVKNVKNINYAWYYLTKTNFSVPAGSAFTFEIRAKVNAPTTGNEFGVRVNNRVVSVFLTYDGMSGTVQNSLQNPSQSYALNTGEYQTYRVVVNSNFSFDVYVNGQYVWSGNAASQTNSNLIKIGAESPADVNMTVDHFRMGIGEMIPESSVPVDTSALESAITNAQTLISQVEIGAELGQYPQHAVDALVAAVEQARFVLNDGKLTQPKVNDAVTMLETAIFAFKSSIVPLPPDFPVFKFEKIVIDPENMKYNPTNEFDFPTVIKAADYFENPLGTYYMYYGPHDNPGGICLAYADSLEGPWIEYEGNPVISNEWLPHYSVSHVASAHPIWIEEEQKLFMYFHGENTTTRLATSEDGIHFNYEQVVVTTADFNDVSEASYARVFKYTIPGKNNKYIMLLMGNNKGNRRIYLAWSNDGRNWETQRTPFISPIKNDQIDHRGNLSGAYYFPWKGRHYVTVHASSGHQYLVEVGENFDRAIHHGPYFEATGQYPDNGRVAARSFIQEGDTVYMFYELGQRGSTKIALAKSVPPEDMLKLHEVQIGIQSPILQVGHSSQLTIVAKRFNKETIDLNQAKVTYFSSDPSIVSVTNGNVQAHKVGVAEVWVEVTLDDVTVSSNKLAIEVRADEVWDIIDEPFNDYSAWTISKGSRINGSVTQGDGHVTVRKDEKYANYAWLYLTKNDFLVPTGAFTFEIRAKVNEPTTGNEFGVRVNNKQISIYLTYDGESGTVQNSLTNPSQRHVLNTGEYQTYRVVVHDDFSFDLYVNGQYVWSGQAVSQNGDNLVKIGAESPVDVNMTIDHFRMNTGELVPANAPKWINGKLEAIDVTQHEVTLAWSGAVDPSGVTQYKIFQNGAERVLLATDELTVTDSVYIYQITGLSAGTTYTFKVEAGNATGKWSEDGPSVTVTTKSNVSIPPITPPVTPPSVTPPVNGGDDTPEKNGDEDVNQDGEDGLDPVEPQLPESIFRDVPEEHWAYQFIREAIALGVVTGYNDGTFRPNHRVTRAEFTAMFVRALNPMVSVTEDLKFTDSDDIPLWARPYVSWAVKAGILKGYGDNTFRANETISRTEMTVMMVRALGLEIVHDAELPFADAGQIMAWARPYVAAAYQAGLIRGRGNNLFAPHDSATRAEAVTLILTMINFNR